MAALERIESYGAVDDAWGEREAVRGEDALAERLHLAALRGERLTLRASGRSFHDQAQGGRVVLVDGLGPPPTLDGERLRAGASTGSRQLLDVALGGGRMVPTVVTGSDITLGGVIAADCVSRASAAYGRCAEGVVSLELLTPDGTRRTVRRGDPLFAAVVGGFGALGVVLEATVHTLDLPWPGVPRVETVGHPVGGPAEVMPALLAALREPAPDPTAPWRGHTDPTRSTPWAITHDEGRAIHFEYRLVPPLTPLAPLELHVPGSLLHQAGQWAASFGPTARHLPGLLYEGVRRRRRFVDTLHGATFMMDGSVQAAATARRLGLRMGALQQSFALPVGPGCDDAGPALRFVERVFRVLRDEGVTASVVDLLALPKDEALLSATREGPGIVVTPAFQHLQGDRAARGRRVLARLSREAAELGGKVHLVKHVFAEPDVLRAMYGPALDRHAALARELDPERVLTSHFLERLERAAR